ncbi:DUF4328 domain-containing protein [Streptomyces sp. NPDC021080]|uniref:DUF4328 domain-containing protein n=1 Tax=Streptomyces sp. NPDC021080 TaxID=3365110 RepID=UPI003799675A
MKRAVKSLGGPALWTCGVLAAYVLVTAATALAAWHKHQVLLAPPLPPTPDGSEGLPLLVADMWFGNVLGWWKGTTVATVLLLMIWMTSMRDLAERLWPEGQRRRRAWLFFGWVVPVADLFVPKMIVNDLWAAAEPAARRRRGHPLLTVWWLFAVAAGAAGEKALSAMEKADTTAQSGRALEWVVLSDGLFICAAVLSICVVRQLSGRLRSALRTASAQPDGLVGTGTV